VRVFFLLPRDEGSEKTLIQNLSREREEA